MWRVMRGDYARAAKIRDGRMHKGRKSVTTQAWVKKGDDKPGKVRVYSADEIRDQEWKRWAEGVKAPEQEVRNVPSRGSRELVVGVMASGGEIRYPIRCSRAGCLKSCEWHCKMKWSELMSLCAVTEEPVTE